jgi:hypothetical protein
MIKEFEVTVGNIGQVYYGQDEDTARRVYDEYVAASEANVGRAGGETVTFWKDGKPGPTFFGWNEQLSGAAFEVDDVMRECTDGPRRFIVDLDILRESYVHARKYGEPRLYWTADDVPTLAFAILTEDGDQVPAFFVPAGED